MCVHCLKNHKNLSHFNKTQIKNIEEVRESCQKTAENYYKVFIFYMNELKMITLNDKEEYISKLNIIKS